LNRVDRSPEQRALEVATDTLLGELGARGHWVGELSSSALSTATAATALALIDRERHAELIGRGLRWLAEHRNADGGWGDTIKSKSNISTTALAWAAFGAAGADEEFRAVVNGAEAWLERAAGGIANLIPAIEQRYGKDRTFSVPILMMCVLGGRLGQNAWAEIPRLPFEVAVLPHQLFGALRLPVVSYALPALIAIGQLLHARHPSRHWLVRTLRDASRSRTLAKLITLQPENGGFLEATPLTSFVTMSLAALGLGEHLVARRGVEFLRASVLEDGSWPIDTNLATWSTTLSIKALAHQPGVLSASARDRLRSWLLEQQYRAEHPYTHAAPGGWAWTDLPGGVPDADDTAGALLALVELGEIDSETRAAGELAFSWLLGLQNFDGGIPTFCRGWGALPFDRSAPDLTAHAWRAWHAWLPHVSMSLQRRGRRAMEQAQRFLGSSQRTDGSWLPLWFGNQDAPDDENPTYGTAQVVLAWRATASQRRSDRALQRAIQWLIAAQNLDGGWSGVRGAPSSTEETALAVEALVGLPDAAEAVAAGTRWLVERVESGAFREPAPIGFYFAKLWYFERLYPLIFTVGALGAVHRHAEQRSAT
jgi:squalene-hopene/tetraprenyl-beta-curcumene cyclase